MAVAIWTCIGVVGIAGLCWLVYRECREAFADYNALIDEYLRGEEIEDEEGEEA